MKKLMSLLAICALSLTLNASDAKKEEEPKVQGEEKQGFFTTKWCADRGMFSNCRLESAVCGYGECFKDWVPGDKEVSDFVLFVHDERKTYTVKLEGVEKYKLLDKAFNRNEVTIIGDIKGNTIMAKGFKAPPPPKKEFFKGCL